MKQAFRTLTLRRNSARSADTTRSDCFEPGEQRLEPRRLDMQPEARVGSREQAAQPGEQDRGGGRAGGEIGGRPLHQRRAARPAPRRRPRPSRRRRWSRTSRRAIRRPRRSGPASRGAPGRGAMRRAWAHRARAHGGRGSARPAAASRCAASRSPEISVEPKPATRPRREPRPVDQRAFRAAAPAASPSHAWSRFPSGSSATIGAIAARRSAPR